jgi:BioD-like phosphotransacetylase family protein
MNAHPILVASIADGTGKTAVTLALARLEQERGRRVGYMKPKGTRLQSSTGKTLDRDPLLARELLELDGEIHQLEPVVYSPTFVEGAIRGQEEPAELGRVVEDRFGELAADVDLMFVEGGGDWTTGGIVDLTDVDVADRLDASVLLVATYGTGADLDRVLAAADAFGDRLAGVLFNDVSDPAFDELERDAVPFLERRGVPVVGVLPHDRGLAGASADDLAGELGADVVVEGDSDAHIERFLIGAMSGDAALRYVRRRKTLPLVSVATARRSPRPRSEPPASTQPSSPAVTARRLPCSERPKRGVSRHASPRVTRSRSSSARGRSSTPATPGMRALSPGCVACVTATPVSTRSWDTTTRRPIRAPASRRHRTVFARSQHSNPREVWFSRSHPASETTTRSSIRTPKSPSR